MPADYRRLEALHECDCGYLQFIPSNWPLLWFLVVLVHRPFDAIGLGLEMVAGVGSRSATPDGTAWLTALDRTRFDPPETGYNLPNQEDRDGRALI